VTAAGEYAPGDPVWLYRNGQWRAGVVLAASTRAAAVRYLPAANRAVGVDTALPGDLVRREEIDQYLDALDDPAGW
jgi:hypothetical protein